MLTAIQISFIVIWTTVIVFSIAVEIYLTGYLFLISAISGAVPLILAILIPEPYWVFGQVFIFLVTWTIFFLLFWKVFKILRFFNSKESGQINNLIGKKGFLLSDSYSPDNSEFHYGYLKVDGIKYRTVNFDEDLILKGSFVKVMQIKGNRLFIKTDYEQNNLNS